MKIGILGGTFNPVHFGHLRAAEEVREVLGLERVLFIPSGNPPLKTEGLADASHRYGMVKLAAAGNRFFDVLDIECARPGKSYTVDTVKTLKEQYSGADLNFILGIDAFLDLPNWYEPEELVSLVDFVVLSRPGALFADLLSSPYLSAGRECLADLDNGEVVSCTLKLRSSRDIILTRVTPMAISSTDIRMRVKKRLTVKYLLPENVESFIISNRLYSAKEDA
ncbi:MAG: nicotinate-nucleotide adenylyltransferase [Candidatus Sulfobium sp.]|jgi:nicotinate-nucleotide adenylyltransferase